MDFTSVGKFEASKVFIKTSKFNLKFKFNYQWWSFGQIRGPTLGYKTLTQGTIHFVSIKINDNVSESTTMNLKKGRIQFRPKLKYDILE